MEQYQDIRDTNLPLIEYKNVKLIRKDRVALNNLTLSIKLVEHVAILGPNGSGKSTLIKTITRELYPLAGGSDSYLRILGRDRWDKNRNRRPGDRVPA